MANFESSEKIVLIADDDPSILRLVRAVVEGEGLKTIAARDGKEAYRILRSGTAVVAAIFDVVMPYIHGTDLVKFMRSDERLSSIPVIMMTAEQSPKMPSASLAAGAVAFLPKPFTNVQLKTILRTFIHRKGA
jgi:two-component system chemotaxis response regulator CheY